MKGQRLSLWVWRERLDAEMPTKAVAVDVSVASVASVRFRVQQLPFSGCRFIRSIRVIR